MVNEGSGEVLILKVGCTFDCRLKEAFLTKDNKQDIAPFLFLCVFSLFCRKNKMYLIDPNDSFALTVFVSLLHFVRSGDK